MPYDPAPVPNDDSAYIGEMMQAADDNALAETQRIPLEAAVAARQIVDQWFDGRLVGYFPDGDDDVPVYNLPEDEEDMRRCLRAMFAQGVAYGMRLA